MEKDPERSIVRLELSPEERDPGPQIAEIVADLEDSEMTGMATMYGCIDGILDDLFSDPPSDEAELSVAFSYEGYRITVDQDGHAELVPME